MTQLALPGSGLMDMSQLSAFLSDPTVLVTAECVADSFLSGSPESLEDARHVMASLLSQGAGPIPGPIQPLPIGSSSGQAGPSTYFGTPPIDSQPNAAPTSSSSERSASTRSGKERSES